MIKECLAKNLLSIAKRFHDEYNKYMLETEPDKGIQQWDELNDDYKYSNIRIVETLEKRLETIRCYITDRPGEDEEIVDDFGLDADKLARLEHEMWMKEREESGWVYGPKRDNDRKIHDMMKPWLSLDEHNRKKDYVVVNSIIPILREFQIYVCRYPDTEKTDEEFRHYTKNKMPLLISVTGHTDIRDEDIEYIEDSLSKMLDDVTVSDDGFVRFEYSDIIIQTALAEGSDRIVAKWAISKGIHVAPVLPIGKDEYKKTFGGIGYPGSDDESRKAASADEFEELLANDLTYSPVIISKGRTNRYRAYAELGAYLVANSQLLIGIWDGRTYGCGGGTYDTIRMAYEGVDQELIPSMPSTSVAFDKNGPEVTASLNAGEDTLIYWIEVERTATREEMEHKFCSDIDRRPVNSCGYFFREDFQIVSRPASITQRIASWLKLERFINKARVDTKTEIESGPVFGKVVERYDSIPVTFGHSFDRISELNKDMQIGSKDLDLDEPNIGSLYVTPEDDSEEPLINSGIMTDMANRFKTIYAVSADYKRRSMRDKMALSVVQAFVTILFSLMILFAGSLVMTVLYTVIYGLQIVVIRQYKGRRVHTKYVEYRSLAESLRVQYYWGILGINDTVTMNCYGFLKNGMPWMRAAIKSCCSAFTNDYNATKKIDFNYKVSFSKKHWIEEKIQYLENEGKENIRKSDRKMFLMEALGVLGMLLAASITVITFFTSDSEITWLSWDAYWAGTKLLIPDMEVGPVMLIKLLMILCTASLGFVTIWRSARFADTEQQSDAKCLIYKLALSKLDALDNTKGVYETRIKHDKLVVLHEVGVQEIDQNNDWVFQFIDKDIQNMKTGLNIRNDGANGGGPDT